MREYILILFFYKIEILVKISDEQKVLNHLFFICLNSLFVLDQPLDK